MNRIKKLPPHVADMIAAGEVVERPGSAVKELMENAIDAGATSLTVEIERGGTSYIRVTDDGCGMSPEDAENAFLRHATSKLRDEFGLEAIRTLGFRGEALAAISAVSDVELLTREKGSAEGFALSLRAGEIVESGPAGCPEGTTIIVRSLFYNTPARLKFMKKDAAEAAFVGNVVTRCALSHPEISVRYIRDGAEEFRTPGDGEERGAVYAVLGRDFAKNMLPVDGSGDGCRVRGFVTTPASARGNRGSQYFFVNGRWVKSALLQAALEQAYKNSLFTGRFPGCVLYLELRFNEVDVNVHPAKTEVKFLSERKVFDAVHLAVKAALSHENEAPELHLSREEKAPAPAAPAAAPARETPLPKTTLPIRQGSFTREDGRVIFRQEAPAYGERRPDRPPITHHALLLDPVDPPHLTDPPAAEPAPAEAAAPAAPAEEAAPLSPAPEPSTPEKELWPEDPAPTLMPEPPAALPPYRIVGECFTEYILVESGGELTFIDKHAAHERMLFDRLKAREYETMSQVLLLPAIVEPGREEKALLLENKALLDELGFEIEDFGGDALAVRRLPADVDAEETEALLQELCEDLRSGARPGSLGVKDELLATVACKAAIKAGRASDPAEWKPVVEAVLSGKVKYCPHGRPVTMRLAKSKLDRNFKRT